MGLAFAWAGCGRREAGETGNDSPADPKALNLRANSELALLRDEGDLAHIDQAARLVAESLRLAPAASNLGALAMQARVAMAAHRFGEARAVAEDLRSRAPGNAYCLEALGDALFELGEYGQAAQAWDAMQALAPGSAGAEARAAQMGLLHGQVGDAKRHLAESLRLAEQAGPAGASGVAGCAVQCGEAEFLSGDWEAAERDYQLALKVVPGGYAATEHLAELRGAQNRVAESMELYLGLVKRVSRPELMQDMGDLLAFAGRAGEAAPWIERARRAYLASIARGEVLYLHHLSGLFADSLNDPKDAVEWARRDLAYRHTIQAYDSLAWALAKDAKADEALAMDDKALATGTRDPHILYHAAMIRMGAGDIAAGKALLLRATESNPRFNAFHVHR